MPVEICQDINEVPLWLVDIYGAPASLVYKYLGTAKTR